MFHAALGLDRQLTAKLLDRVFGIQQRPFAEQ